ncbi:hypothetical protein DPMN_009973 [Dreissena polymorpha]|uniref:Uncharacterized protein n=1 Tax=Dreissena polymorpha TaxID=45954 RepID=A0A9D4S0I9_DREPO|nr:hypothetical protein DPMN_009973 [Dreissena polymorpha]
MDPRRQGKARETLAYLETHSGRGNKRPQPLLAELEKACKRPTTVENLCCCLTCHPA